VTDPIGASPAPSSTLRRWLCGVAVVYIVLSLSGLTTSSLGIDYLSETRGEHAPGVLVGTPRFIRIDEWNRGTPWLLGLMARGDDGFASPLAFPDVALVAPTARDVPSALLHWEALAAKTASILPDSLVFAAIWWSPVALVAALLPLWLSRLGARPGIAVATTSLVLLAPANHWWSLGPLGVLAPPLLGAVLALAALDRWRVRGADLLSVCAIAVSALCVARAGLGYAPWTIPLTTAVFVPTLAAALSSVGRRLAVTFLGGVFAAGVVLAGLIVARSDAVDVIAGTVYPGDRRSLGEFVGLGLLFGAPHTWILEAGTMIARGTNESEVTSGYLLLAVPSLVLATAIGWRALPVRAPAIAASGVLLGCLTWVTFDWPASIGHKLGPATLVPPDRLAQVVGLVATIVFGLVLSAWADAPRGDRRVVVAVVFGLTALVTVLGGRTLRDEALPQLPWGAIVFVSLVVALAVALAIWRPDRPLALAALPVVALLVVVDANPLQHGLGDLRGSRAAKTVTDEGRSLGKSDRWASDDPSFDALLMANGQRSLTGQQWIGPQAPAWALLDPHDRSRWSWNRGASYIRFQWTPGKPTRIDTLGEDSIRVRIDPCAPGLKRLGLALVVSSGALDAPCLVPKGRIAWGEVDRWVYGV
jgi:hypothetical protein